MTFSSAVRRFAFTAHMTSSIGWIGAVLVFVALAALGLTSESEGTVRGAYLLMAPTAWFVLVPLAHASLLSGVALSLGTSWGLFRHYWVVFKLLITAFSTIILLTYMRTFGQMAGLASDPAVDLDAVRNLSPMLHSVLALVLLFIATWLGVYKPFGLTPYGERRAQERISASAWQVGPIGATFSQRQSGAGRAHRSTDFYLLLGIGVLLLLFLVLHFVGDAARWH